MIVKLIKLKPIIIILLLIFVNSCGIYKPGVDAKKYPPNPKERVKNNMEDLQYDLDYLSHKDRVNAIIQLINYTTPKLKSLDAQVTAIDGMSEAKIKKLERMDALLLDIKAEQKNAASKLKEPNSDIFDNEE